MAFPIQGIRRNQRTDYEVIISRGTSGVLLVPNDRIPLRGIERIISASVAVGARPRHAFECAKQLRVVSWSRVVESLERVSRRHGNVTRVATVMLYHCYVIRDLIGKITNDECGYR